MTPVEPVVLVVNGSPRKGGNSDLAAARVLDGVRQAGRRGTEVRLRELAFRSCIGCEGCRRAGRCVTEDDLAGVYPEVERSQGIVLISPVHNYNVTAWMKAFVDRLYCYYEFEEPRPGPWSSRLAGQGRKAAVVAIGEQHAREDMGFTLEAMAWPLKALGYEVVREVPVLGVFGRGELAGARDALAELETCGRELAAALG
ncbi:flavodoxin family protein [Deferrisoma palaeochoriense]